MDEHETLSQKNETSEGFELENHKKEKLVIDLVYANIFGILVLVPTVLLSGIPYFLIWRNTLAVKLPQFFNLKYLIAGVVIFFLGIVAHELIHGIVFAKYAKSGFRAIKFGILLKMLTPYCHCKEMLKVKHYLIGAVMPAIILGIIPLIVALCTGNPGILFFGILFTVAASGDFLMIKLLWKEDKESWVQDHPSEAGCYIYRRIN